MKTYRGWTLTFANGVYTAKKKDFVPLQAENRVGIERLIDAREFVEWQRVSAKAIKAANEFIRKLKQLACEKAETN